MTGNNLYRQTRDLAILVDAVLINLRHPSVMDSTGQRERLGKMLIDLAENTWSDPAIRILAVSLHELHLEAHEFQSVGEALVQAKNLPTVEPFLEQLASTLEQDQAEAFARSGW